LDLNSATSPLPDLPYHLPDVSIHSSDLTNSRSFKPYHERLREYRLRRAAIFNADALTIQRSRSSLRMQKFWKEKRRLNCFTISAIVQKGNDIRPFTQIEILNESYLALLDSGANKSVIGSALAKRIISEQINLSKVNGVVHTADGFK